MIKISYIIITAIVFLSGIQLNAEIVETKEMSAVQDYVTADSLLLFNITGTLYDPATTFADNRWRVYLTKRVNAIVSDQETANKFINKIKNEIVSHLPKKAVEDFTPHFVNRLQCQRIPVLGITQKRVVAPYADNFAAITSNHLLSLGINMENTLSYFKVQGEDGVSHSFAYGIIFTNHMPVGPAIVEFLSRLENQPSRIIIVDNDIGNLINAESSLNAIIPFTGFRYVHSDNLKRDFDPTLGNIQLFAYINEKKIISDEQAMHIKQTHPELDYDKLLDDFILENSL